MTETDYRRTIIVGWSGVIFKAVCVIFYLKHNIGSLIYILSRVSANYFERMLRCIFSSMGSRWPTKCKVCLYSWIDSTQRSMTRIDSLASYWREQLLHRCKLNIFPLSGSLGSVKTKCDFMYLDSFDVKRYYTLNVQHHHQHSALTPPHSPSQTKYCPFECLVRHVRKSMWFNAVRFIWVATQLSSHCMPPTPQCKILTLPDWILSLWVAG